jgi:hypothetical protein
MVEELIRFLIFAPIGFIISFIVSTIILIRRRNNPPRGSNEDT